MTLNLTGSLLLSTPAIGDPRFARSVIYLCAHSGDGAFGLVVNRPVPFLKLRAVLEQLGLTPGAGVADVPVLGGGPVETQRGFVLHSADWSVPAAEAGEGDGSGAATGAVESGAVASDASDSGGAEAGGGGGAAVLPGGLVLSASTEVLAAIARGAGPARWLLALGYAGWGPGQLEGELAQNAWLTCPADPALIFDPDRGEGQWLRALRGMGIDPVGLSAQSGRA